MKTYFNDNGVIYEVNETETSFKCLEKYVDVEVTKITDEIYKVIYKPFVISITEDNTELIFTDYIDEIHINRMNDNYEKIDEFKINGVSEVDLTVPIGTTYVQHHMPTTFCQINSININNKL